MLPHPGFTIVNNNPELLHQYKKPIRPRKNWSQIVSSLEVTRSKIDTLIKTQAMYNLHKIFI